MNWLKIIPIAWKDKGIIENVVQEAKQMEGTKPGWKTSTFWVKIFTVDLPVIYMGIKGFLPPETAVKIEVVAMGIYAIYRTVVGMAKELKKPTGTIGTGTESATATATVTTAA